MKGWLCTKFWTIRVADHPSFWPRSVTPVASPMYWFGQPTRPKRERERERERKRKKEKKKKLRVWPLKVAESPPTATGVVWPPYKAKEEKIK